MGGRAIQYCLTRHGYHTHDLTAARVACKNLHQTEPVNIQSQTGKGPTGHGSTFGSYWQYRVDKEVIVFDMATVELLMISLRASYPCPIGSIGYA